MILDVITAAVILYLILNVCALALFWADKRKAVKGRYRIRESTLMVSGLFGPFGALAGMEIFRHKTRKMKFKAVYIFIAIHVVIMCSLYVNTDFF